MSLTLSADPVPLRLDASGTARVGRTRVTLDTVVATFETGATPEEIAQQFPALTLADIYLVVGYYLRHRPEVEAYLAPRQLEAQRMQEQAEREFPSQQFRERLLARQRSAGA